MTTHRRTLCQEAHELLLARQDDLGDLTNAAHRVAEDVSRRTGSLVPTETAVWVLIEQHLLRDRHEPENPDHLREVIAHLAILAQVRADQRAWEEMLGRRAP